MKPPIPTTTLSPFCPCHDCCPLLVPDNSHSPHGLVNIHQLDAPTQRPPLAPALALSTPLKSIRRNFILQAGDLLCPFFGRGSHTIQLLGLGLQLVLDLLHLL